MSSYDFTNTWFVDSAKNVWDQLIPTLNPSRILEVGSFEGQSACYLIEKLANNNEIELHCIDTWEGGDEHKVGGSAFSNMVDVEYRFKSNVKIAMENASNYVNLIEHKGCSDVCLASLLAEGKRNYFDFVYIDGSHLAPDVLCDAVLGFKLLKVGGVMAFDDYLWAENLPSGKDITRCPKIAIDSFINLNFKKLNVLSAPLYQIYIQKTGD